MHNLILLLTIMATSTIADINSNLRNFIVKDFQEATEYSLPFTSPGDAKRAKAGIPTPYKFGDLPLNQGGRTMELPILLPADGTAVEELSETAQPTSKKGQQYSNATIALKEYGSTVQISRRMSLLSYFRHVKDSIKQEGQNAAIFCNAVMIAAFAKDPMTLTAGAIASAGGFKKDYVGATQTQAGLYALSNDAGKLTYLKLCELKTKLFNRKTKGLAGGGYMGVFHASVLLDLKSGVNSDLWTDVIKYQMADIAVEGEVGMVGGIRCVETNFGLIEGSTALTPLTNNSNEAKPIYSSFIFGAEAYGIPKLSGTNSPAAPSIQILDQPDKSDAQNRWVYLPWNVHFAALATHPDRGIHLRSHAANPMIGEHCTWPTNATLAV